MKVLIAALVLPLLVTGAVAPAYDVETVVNTTAKQDRLHEKVDYPCYKRILTVNGHRFVPCADVLRLGGVAEWVEAGLEV